MQYLGMPKDMTIGKQISCLADKAVLDYENTFGGLRIPFFRDQGFSFAQADNPIV